MPRLAIVTSHPIQYNAPLFGILTKRGKIQLKVFYTWGQSEKGPKYDPGFGREIEWDIPLLSGYEYAFVKNTSSHPGSGHYNGIVNPTLTKELEAWKPDVLLVFGWSFQSHLKCLRYFHKKLPVLFRGDSTLLDEKQGLKTALRRLFLKWMYSHVDYALYTGIHNKNYFLKHGLRNEQLVFAPHAVDNGRFAEPDELFRREALINRNSLGIKDDDLLILFAGKFEPKKNPFLLMELFRALKDPRLKILFAGNGILEIGLKEAAAGHAGIFFMDFQNQQQMPVLYRMADLFMLPSRGPGETWGLSVNEAMACGLPVAVSDKTGCGPDLVKNYINGFIFDHDNIGSLISFMQRMLDNKQMLRSMGEQSKKIVAGFSFDRVAGAVEEAVASL